MPTAHPAHIVAICALLVSAVLIGVSLGTPWTEVTATLQNGMSATNDRKLFQVCQSVGGDSMCKSWDDYLTLTEGSGAISYCTSIGTTGDATNSDVMARVHTAEALAVCCLLQLLLHTACVTVWALGKGNTRCTYIITGVIATALGIGAMSAWGAMLGVCDKSYCDAVTNVGINQSASCGPNAGFFLIIIALVIKILCYIPLRCWQRPQDIAAASVVTYALIQQQQQQPVVVMATTYQQPGFVVQQGYAPAPQQQIVYAQPQPQVYANAYPSQQPYPTQPQQQYGYVVNQPQTQCSA